MRQEIIDDIHRMANDGYSRRGIAELLSISRDTVARYWPDCKMIIVENDTRYVGRDNPPRMPDPSSKAGGPSLPPPVPLTYKEFDTQASGTWLVLGDVHIPYHDQTTVELAVEEASRRGAKGVLLNGDVLDSHEVSDHERDRDALTYVEEIQKGKEFLRWIRSRLPAARVVFKAGNHDERVDRYVLKRAPALVGLEGVCLQAFLKMDEIGVEWVGDKRVVKLGKLPIIHGHEYRGGGGVNPARWLFLRTVTTSMCGHFHRASEHHQRGLTGTVHGVWSVACACYIHPRWMPLNEWGHGFAFVTVGQNGDFHVENKRIMNGKMY